MASDKLRKFAVEYRLERQFTIIVDADNAEVAIRKAGAMIGTVIAARKDEEFATRAPVGMELIEALRISGEKDDEQ